MMLINGPLPISPNDQVGKTDYTFRPYQRVVAEVLNVTATQAILSVEGVTVVARLTSPEQAAALKDQRMARFIVTQANENTINFKLIQSNQSPPSLETAGLRQDLVGRFLAELNLAANSKNLTLTQAMLNQRLPLTPELFNELNIVLAQFSDWSADLASLAAQIKSAGLPLTPDSLALAARNGQGVQTFENLLSLMKEALGRENLPEGFRALLETGIRLFSESWANLEMPEPDLAKSLENQVQLNGRSLENILAELDNEKTAFWPEKSLAVLARLYNLAKNTGDHELAKELSSYLDQVRQTQFWNAHPGRPLNQVMEEWLKVPLYVQITGDNGEVKGEDAHLRILRETQNAEGTVDPANTRLVIEMDAAPGQVVRVCISLSGKQTWTDIEVANEDLLEYANLELPELEDGIQNLGYTLMQNNLRVSKPAIQTGAQPLHGHGMVTLTINMEV